MTPEIFLFVAISDLYYHVQVVATDHAGDASSTSAGPGAGGVPRRGDQAQTGDHGGCAKNV